VPMYFDSMTTNYYYYYYVLLEYPSR